MRSKRYEKQVDLTLRIPQELRDRARELVQAIEGERITTPGTDALVKPSIAVLALRGLERELLTQFGRLNRQAIAREFIGPVIDEWEKDQRRKK